MNVSFLFLACIFTGSMEYQWIRYACEFTPDSKGVIASMIQGIGTILAAIVNFLTMQFSKKKLTTISWVHFIFFCIFIWATFAFLIIFKLDQYGDPSTEPMLQSSQIDTDRPPIQEDTQPTVIVIKSKIELELEGVKFLPLEKKMYNLLSAKNNYLYMALITLLITGVNYPYFLNMWYNRMLLTGKKYGDIDLAEELADLSKVKMTVKGNRLYPEIFFPLVQILFGYLADNYPKRYQILTAYICSGASTVLLFFIEKSFAIHLLSFIFGAIGYGAMNGILLRLLMDKYLIKNLMDSASIFGMCYYVSAIVFGYVSLFIIGYFKKVNKLFAVIIGGVFIAMSILILFIKEPLITSAHYFDVNYVDNKDSDEYKSPKLDSPGILIDDKEGSEGMQTLDNKISSEPEKVEHIDEEESEKKDEPAPVKEEEKKEPSDLIPSEPNEGDGTLIPNEE